MMKSRICIYHKNCADGFGAALAVKSYWDAAGVAESDQEFFPAHYGDTPPDVEGKEVMIVDFSYDRQTLVDMNESAAKLTVIDHHKTAEEALKGLDFCHFDMSQSGAMLTYKHLFPESIAPLLFDYIQDRDLWQWKLPMSKEVSAALQAIPMRFEDWSPYLVDNNIEILKMQGETILRYQRRIVDKVASGSLPMINFLGHDVPCVNTTTLISEIGNELSKSHPFAVMYFDVEGKRVYSLRSQEYGEDVSAIAKKFGGGGHACAAGFSVSHDILLMSKSNPFGYNLSDLLECVANELEAKTDDLEEKVPREILGPIVRNNRGIVSNCRESVKLENHTAAALERIAAV